MSTANRIIKNTGYLYLKMGITIFISLYTTRLILNSLGASDYGIYNIVGGAIALLGFFNSTMANATQRFMSYAEGEGNIDSKRKIFNVSLILHLGVAFLSLVLLLAFMYPLFHNILNIASDRIIASKIVYLCLVFSTVLTIVNVPYDSVMNAHENMLYFAFVGIIESLLRLIIAFVIVYTSKDKLVIYGILSAIVPLITLTIMKLYCHRHYDECRIAPRRYWDIKLLKEIFSFSGWNFLTAITSLFTFQGLGLVLNHFYGTVLNAAQGIAQQVNGQLTSCATNMMKAINPVIVKSVASGNSQSINGITISGCKYSTYIILLFAVPFLIELPFILKVWLKSVPLWTGTFCALQIVLTIICQMASSAATAIYGKGEIKGYAIYKSIMNISPIILTYISFKLGGSPYWLYIPMIVIWGIGGDMVIVMYAKRKCNLDVKKYIMGVVNPIIIVTALMFIFGYLPTLIMLEGFFRLIITIIATTMGMIIAMGTKGMNDTEKLFVKNLILQRLGKSLKE